MLFLEGKVMILEDNSIDIILFIPSNKDMHMIPINIQLPEMNNAYFSTSQYTLNVKYAKANDESSILPNMRDVHNPFSYGKDCMKLSESNLPCTVTIEYIFVIHDTTNSSVVYKQCGLTLLLDITDTIVRIHWRKSYNNADGINEEIVGSTDNSLLQLSYNNDNIIQFILVDPSDIVNNHIPYIAVKEIEPDDIYKYYSIINPFNLVDISNFVLSQTNPDWIYNTGEYAKLIYTRSTKTEILPIEWKILENKRDEQQSGDNI